MARTWAEIEKLEGGLSPAEKKLVECCKAGTECRLGDERPDGPSDAHTIRAEVLRYLILGGCEDCRVHEWGVQLEGAWVKGALDLSFATAKGQTTLFRCVFPDPIVTLNAQFISLCLDGSAVCAIHAENVIVSGDVLMRCGFKATGVVRFAGARVGGAIECDGGAFLNPGGDALNLQSAQIGGAVFLRRGFFSKGAVSLSIANIGGQVSCVDGKFENAGNVAIEGQNLRVVGSVLMRGTFNALGEVSLSSAEIGGQLDCSGATFSNKGGYALNAQRMRVSAGIYWRKVSVLEGDVSLASAHVGDLVDDLPSWPTSGRNHLNGFTYDRIGGEFTAVNFRLQWLERVAHWKGDFFPQTYRQLAKYYRGIGSSADARKVSIKRVQLTQEHDRKRAYRALNGDLEPALRSISADVQRFFGFISRIVVGYGFDPFRSVKWLIGLWLFAITFAHFAWTEGSMVPNSDVILTSADWQAYESRTHAGAEWSASTAPGQDWETFNRYAWGADLVIPILDLGQTSAWAPSTSRGAWGWHLWWLSWVLEAGGWIIFGFVTAAIPGIIRKDDD